MKKKPVKYRLLYNSSGLTMIELIISIAVLAILTSVITPIFKQGTGLWQTTQSQVELHQNLNFALELMTKTIRQADLNSVVPTVGSASNPGDNIMSCYVDDSPRSFVLRRGSGDCVYIELNSEPVTSTTLITITRAVVKRLESGAEGYSITISGRYEDNKTLNDTAKELTVKTTVFLRQDSDIESWKEIN